MGFLTTFTISNDALDILEDDPKQVCDKLFSAALKGEVQELSHHYKPKKKNRWSRKKVGRGVHCNPIKVQKCRHADDWTIYVHAGNTVVEMNQYSEDTEQTLWRNPEYFEDMIKFMQKNVTAMKKKLKEHKEAHSE
jgi:hypothetical protein